MRLKKRADLPGLDAVLDIGAHPVFDVRVDLGTAMDQRRTGAVPPEIKRGFRGDAFLHKFAGHAQAGL